MANRELIVGVNEDGRLMAMNTMGKVVPSSIDQNLLAEVARLREENRQLRAELDAFSSVPKEIHRDRREL